VKKNPTPTFKTANGYLTERIRLKYIHGAIQSGLLPENAHRMPHIISLTASDDENTPIQFWQLYSVLGHDRIIAIVRNFYQRVFADEPWFTDVFAKVGGLEHHIRTQSSMWIDVMGGGRAYHGGEYRLSFYADEFSFSTNLAFGELNPPLKRKINLMNMTSDAIEALSEQELRDALIARGIDVSQYTEKQALVNHALRL